MAQFWGCFEELLATIQEREENKEKLGIIWNTHKPKTKKIRRQKKKPKEQEWMSEEWKVNTE